MNRRNFLKNTSVAGLAIPTIIVSCNNTDNNAPGKQVLNVPAGDPLADSFELKEVTIDSLQQKMRDGSYTSRQITELYLKRIELIDKNGPKLNSVIEINPDALAIADAMDKERKAGKIRSAMHGIPVLIKDNIDTADKMETTAGALALVGNRAPKDAFIVSQLRKAGAVILGKTNLSEWANFRSTRSTSGWSSRGGQTHNPYILNRNPSGSSSGSAVAVSANLCAVSIGTETDGSITSPAAINGIVGLKPTVGLVSRSGIIPISATQDTAGPMARSVRDAAILLGAIIGIDQGDAVTAGSKDRSSIDYTTFLKPDVLTGKRIGIEKQMLSGNNEKIVGLYKNAIDQLKRLGAEVVEVELLAKMADLGEAEFTVLKYEFKDGVNRYLASGNAPVKTLAGVIAYNKQNEEKAMPFFKQEILESCEEKGGLGSKEYLEALKKTLAFRKIIDEMLSNEKLDAIASITSGAAWYTDQVNGDYSTGFYFPPPAAMAGYPHITIPLGDIQDLPVGFSFISGAYKEGEILGMAYSFEQSQKGRGLPRFLQS